MGGRDGRVQKEKKKCGEIYRRTCGKSIILSLYCDQHSGVSFDLLFFDQDLDQNVVNNASVTLDVYILLWLP